MKPESRLTPYEMIDGPTLAERWRVPPTWVRKHVTGNDRIPHIKMGRYVRFAWDSPELNDWLSRRYMR
jgi:hypothetical protein